MSRKNKYPNLKALMAQKNLIQEDLAKLLNINPATLSKKMTGKVDFTSTEMFKLKEHFDCELDYIFLQHQSSF